MGITPGQVIEAADVNALAKVTVSETEVFSGESPNDAWVDLVLSGTVGAKSTLVILKFSSDEDGTYFVRKNGDTDDFRTNNNQSGGAASSFQTANQHIVLVVCTDSSGVFEWYTGAPITTTIDIIAYINSNG